MTRQFSLAYYTVPDCSPVERVHLAANTGFDFVGFRTSAATEPEFSPLFKNKAMLRDTKAALDHTGVKLLDIEVVVIDDAVDPKRFQPAFELAAELGGRHVITAVMANDRNYIIECFSKLCELAKPYGLTIDLEFVTWYKVSTLGEAMDIVTSSGCENGGILIDPLHLHRARGKLDELGQVPRKWIHFVQICDAPANIPTTKEELIHTAREERLCLGEGGIDVGAIIRKIPNVPYSIEIPHIKRVKEMGVEQYARHCLETSKQYIDNCKNLV